MTDMDELSGRPRTSVIGSAPPFDELASPWRTGAGTKCVGTECGSLGVMLFFRSSSALVPSERFGELGGRGECFPTGSYGPVATMMQHLPALAQTGGFDSALLATKHFYQTDYTKPILFLADGSYLEGRAISQHLAGDQWGMMNETGNYPGQAWLWLCTFWYQVAPFKNSGNANAEILVIMMVLTLGLILVPFIPGLRSLPEKLRVYRLIWRDYYRPVEKPRESTD